MTDSKNQFVNRLLAADPLSPAARGRYENEVRAMFEKTLSRNERRRFLAGAVLMGSAAVVCCFDAAAGWLDGPPAVRYEITFFGVTAIALFLVAGSLLRSAWTGVVNRRTIGRLATGLGAAFVGTLGLFLLVVIPQLPESLRDDARALGVLLLAYAAVAWVQHTVLQAEARTTEKLLEIELRLAELAQDGRPQTLAEGPPQDSSGTVTR